MVLVMLADGMTIATSTAKKNLLNFFLNRQHWSIVMSLLLQDVSYISLH